MFQGTSEYQAAWIIDEEEETEDTGSSDDDSDDDDDEKLYPREEEIDRCELNFVLFRRCSNILFNKAEATDLVL